MIILFIVTCILYIMTAYLSLYTYYTMKKNNEELEKRILDYEKRDTKTNRFIKLVNNDMQDKFNNLSNEIKDLKNRKCKCRKEVK